METNMASTLGRIPSGDYYKGNFEHFALALILKNTKIMHNHTIRNCLTFVCFSTGELQKFYRSEQTTLTEK